MEKEEFTEICNNVEKDLDTFYKVIYSEGEINSNKDPYYKMVLLHKIIKRLIINYCEVVYEHKISYQHECNLNDYLNCEINDYH